MIDFGKENSRIVDGFRHNSTSVLVESHNPMSTAIIIADHEELGRAKIVDNFATIPLSRPLREGEILAAYTDWPGNRSAAPVVVMSELAEKSGWNIPKTVKVDGVELSYEDYLKLGNPAIPATYNPQSLNRLPDILTTLYQKVYEKPLLFDLDVQHFYAANGSRSVTVSVRNVQNVKSGYIVQFDSDPASQNGSKTYTADLIQGSVTVFDPEEVATGNRSRSIKKTFGFTLPPAIAVPSAQVNPNILNIIAEAMQNGDSKLLFIQVVATGLCEYMIDNVVPAYQSLNITKQSVRSNTTYYHQSYFLANTAPEGILTLRVRLKSDATQTAYCQIVC